MPHGGAADCFAVVWLTLRLAMTVWQGAKAKTAHEKKLYITARSDYDNRNQ